MGLLPLPSKKRKKMKKMKSTKITMKKQKVNILMSLTLLGLFPLFLEAKELKGTIRDAKTQTPIIGATVLLKGSSSGVISGVDGTYSLDGLSTDSCIVTIDYMGYQSIEQAVALQDEVTVMDFSMQDETLEAGNVQVVARRRSDTEAAMVNTEKNIPQIASGISAVQISKSPDRNTSEVVRRIPGITIIDDRFIIVRGLSQRYNNAWLNGLAVPSTEADSRAFSFDMIPSSQIDNLLVYKSPSPEIPGDFAGGFVKITTKGVPDENSMEFSYTTGFNTRTQFHRFLINPGSKTDFLGFDLNKRPLRGMVPDHMGTVTDPEQITRLTKYGFNNDWRVRVRTPIPDQRLSFALGRRLKTQNDKEIGNVTTITYSNTFKTIRDIQNSRYGLYSVTSDLPVYLDDYVDNQYSNDVRIGAMHNWSFELNGRDRIEFKNLLNILGRNRLTERTGTKDISSTYYREQTEMLYSSRLSYSGQLSGYHTIKQEKGQLDWNVGYSYANRNEPDRRIITNQAGIGSETDIPNVVLKNDNITRYYQTLHDHILSGGVNYKKKLGQGNIQPELKVGGYAEYRSREYTPREFVYRYDNLSYEERNDYLTLPYAQMMDERYLGADKVYIDEITKKTNAYSATVHQEAVYGALDLPLGKLNIYAGVRLENYTMKLTRDKSNSADQTLISTKTHRNTDFLPSANITYKFSPKHQLRMAYGRSLNRPELREVSPAVYFDFDLFSEIGGNENLKTAYINNVDLRYEFYPSTGEVISLGLFYKHFRNPIEWTYIDMGGSLRYNYENAASANNMGIELDLRKSLDFMKLPDFSLVLNAAYIHSNVRFNKEEVLTQPDRPMQGQSPYVINAGLFYQNDRIGLTASLLYNRIGKRIIGIGKSNSIDNDVNSTIPDSYEMPRNSLDLTVSKTVGKLVELRCTVKDLLSEDVVYKQFPKYEKDGQLYEREQVTRSFNPGSSVTLGISVKIN